MWRGRGLEARLREGLKKTPIPSVGPAVSGEMASHGLAADIYPANDAFFVKPLISEMAGTLQRTRHGRPRSSYSAARLASRK